MTKGIVMSAYDVTIEKSLFKISAEIPPEYLRYFCLYWDRIKLIDASPVRCGFDGEKQLLREAGILSVRTAHNPDWKPGNIASKDMGKELTKYVVTRHFSLAAQEMGCLLLEEPNQWTIHQNGSKLLLPDSHRVEQLTAKIELTNCLPVPRADIPLDKVLDFKVHRKSELESLHGALTELYLKVIASSDIPTAQDYYVKQLKCAIKDLNTVSNEKFGSCKLASRKIALELNSASFLAGYGASTFFDSPVSKVGAFVLGGVLSSVKLTAEKSFEHKNSIGSGQLSYLSAIQENELSVC